MTQFSDEFERVAHAERLLCVEAGPALDTIVRSIEARTGLVLQELRVTFDRTNGGNGFSIANCTIVRADLASAAQSNDVGGIDASGPVESKAANHSPHPGSKSADG
jgi:hypothetical protein